MNMEFIYFSDEWNDQKIRKGNIDKGRVAPCVGHAYASEEQEEVYQKNKAQK